MFGKAEPLGVVVQSKLACLCLGSKVLQG